MVSLKKALARPKKVQTRPNLAPADPNESLARAKEVQTGPSEGLARPS